MVAQISLSTRQGSQQFSYSIGMSTVDLDADQDSEPHSAAGIR